MTGNQPCPRCKHLVPPSHFIGVRVHPVKHCAGCHKQAPVTVPRLETHITSSASPPSIQWSCSPSLTASPPPDRAARNRSDVASAASVVALETCFSSLEQSLNSQIGELLAAFQASWPLTIQPPQPPASLPSLQVPQALQALPLLQALPSPPQAPPAAKCQGPMCLTWGSV